MSYFGPLMIDNHSSFQADLNAGWDHNHCVYDAVVVSASFDAQPGSSAVVSAVAATIRAVDEYSGEPGFSSVAYEADIAPEKPRVDVLVRGKAYAPEGRRAQRMMIGVSIGDISKKLLVTGDRVRSSVVGRTSTPEYFDSMPVVYERAFGGSDLDRGHMDVRNPIGIGFRNCLSRSPYIQSHLPNIEYPDERADPAGFGIVARHWEPRVGLAGTYDEDWVEKRFPILPTDFDPLYYQAAPFDQQSESIIGGESVTVRNMTPDGHWNFTLPSLDMPLHLWYADGVTRSYLRMDTVLLEPEHYRVTLIARAKIPKNRHRPPLRQAILGHMTGGWWRALAVNKAYIDTSGRGGRDTSRPEFLA